MILSASLATVTIDDGRHDIDLPGVALTGDGIDACAPLDSDGEVTRLHGVYPSSMRARLEAIAADAARYGDGRYVVDADGWDLVQEAA